MKNVIIGIVLLMVGVVVMGCGQKSEASAIGQSNPKTFSSFAPRVITDQEKTMLYFQPFSFGVEGDGYIIAYNGKKYFLAEGEAVNLKSNQRYYLTVFRVFSTSKGLIVTNTSDIEVGAGYNNVESDQLDLAEAPEVNGWLLKPRVIPNFRDGNIRISTYYYQGPPSSADEVEVVFNSFIRAGAEPIYEYSAVSEGKTVDFRLPDDNVYTEVIATLLLNDTLHGRTIVSEQSWMEFTR